MLFGSSPTCFEGVRGHGAGKSRGSAEGFLSCGWKSGTWGQQDPVLACWDGGSLGQLLGFGIYAGMLWGGVALPGSRARFQAPELNLLPPKGLGMDRSCLLALLGAAVGKPRAGETALEVGAALHKPVPAQQAAPPPFLVIPDESETSPACSSFARWAVCLFFPPSHSPGCNDESRCTSAAPASDRSDGELQNGRSSARLFAEPISAWFYALHLAH